MQNNSPDVAFICCVLCVFVIQKLFETVIDYLVELDVTDGTFDMVKDQLKRTYHNNYIKPSNLVT